MWWEIGWDSWVFGLGGLIVGLVGVAVGIGAWIYAARANKTATAVSGELDRFERRLDDKLEKERILHGSTPVIRKAASLSIFEADDYTLHLRNGGTADAFNVLIEPANDSTGIDDTDQWGVIPAGESEVISLRSRANVSEELEIQVSWQVDGSGERQSRVLGFPRERRGSSHRAFDR